MVVNNVSFSHTAGTRGNGFYSPTNGPARPLIVAGNKVYIQSGTYTVTAVVAWTVAGTAANPVLIEGYATSHGDLGTPPVMTSSTNSVVLMSFNASDFYTIRNIKFTHTAATRGVALQPVTTSSVDFRVDRCIIDGASIAFDGSSRPPNAFAMTRCLIQNCNNTTAAVQCSGSAAAASGVCFHGNVFYNNSGAGYSNNGNTTLATFIGNVFAKNVKQGIIDSGTTRAQLIVLIGNTFVDNTLDAFSSTETQGSGSLILGLANNIFYGNGGYGVDLTPTDSDGRALFNYGNAYGSNNGGGTGLDRLHLSAGIGDITITADPFVSHSGSNTNWGLNTTAGGGAALRAAALPGTWTGITAVSYLDDGGLQHQDSGGAAGMLYITDMDGL